MDIYRITKHDGQFSYKKDVRYGTRRRVAAVIRAAREVNDTRRWCAERWPDRFPYLPITVTVERAPKAEFFDCTAEFTKEGE